MLDEDVGEFEVPVDDRVLVEVLVPSDELFHDDDALRFRQFLSLFQPISF